MFVRLLVLILFFSLTAISIYPQSSDLIQIKGMVVNSNKEPLPFVHILITNKARGTISKGDGEFSFFTEKGDTVLFSSMGYKRAQKIIPHFINERIYYMVVVLFPDTILISETLILPWKTYNEFKDAVITVKLPEDDYDRASKNLALMELQQILYPDEMPIASGAAHRLFMYDYYDKLYYRGQTQPMQIFNIFAWQEFFEYLKEGKFKSKPKL